jgi:hypothetical protein
MMCGDINTSLASEILLSRSERTHVEFHVILDSNILHK